MRDKKERKQFWKLYHKEHRKSCKRLKKSAVEELARVSELLPTVAPERRATLGHERRWDAVVYDLKRVRAALELLMQGDGS